MSEKPKPNGRVDWPGKDLSGDTDEYNPEKALWRDVIIQAFRDSFRQRSWDNITTAEAEEAREWLTEGCPDFMFVCDHADWDADKIKQEALKHKENNWKHPGFRLNPHDFSKGVIKGQDRKKYD